VCQSIQRIRFTSGIRTGWPKNCTIFVRPPYLYQILTDFLNYFTVRIRRNFVIIPSLKILLYLKCVATLPCEMSRVYTPNSVIDMIHVSGSINVTFSRRRYFGVVLAVCVSSTESSTIHDNQPAEDVLLQKSSRLQLLLLRHLTFHKVV